MTFEQLGLSSPLLRAVSSQGYTSPTPIQTQAIPHVLAGSDVLGCAQTGTGKTAAFALPILDRLTHVPQPPRDRPRAVRVLVLSPTRELDAQIADSFGTYGRHTGLRHAVVFKASSIAPVTAVQINVRAAISPLTPAPMTMASTCESGVMIN